MPIKHSRNIRDIVRKVDRFTKLEAPRIAGVEAKSFFKQRFVRQGWEDTSFKAWTKRASQDRGSRGSRKILVKTGALMNSIQYELKGPGKVQVMAKDIPYAKIHNEGGTISGTHTVRSHRRRTRSAPTQVRSHSRSVNTTIPKRQFMGSSKALDRKIEKALSNRIKRILNS